MCVCVCVCVFRAILKLKHPDFISLYITCNIVVLCLGRGGQRIRELEEKSGARIKVYTNCSYTSFVCYYSVCVIRSTVTVEEEEGQMRQWWRSQVMSQLDRLPRSSLMTSSVARTTEVTHTSNLCVRKQFVLMIMRRWKCTVHQLCSAVPVCPDTREKSKLCKNNISFHVIATAT